MIRITPLNRFFALIEQFFLLGLLMCISFTFFYLHWYEYLTYHAIKNDQAAIAQWTAMHYKAAVGLYILIFTVMIACAIPCATLLTLLGGFFFGSVAILYATLSTTLGGMILFLTIRTTIGTRIAEKSTGWIKKMESGFQKNAFHYLLMLRLVPIFPCWISNVAAGALNVALKTFISATILGILPATVIYVMAGRGLDQLLNAQQTPSLTLVFTPSVLFPLLGLAILSLFPVIYKHVKKQ